MIAESCDFSEYIFGLLAYFRFVAVDVRVGRVCTCMCKCKLIPIQLLTLSNVISNANVFFMLPILVYLATKAYAEHIQTFYGTCARMHWFGSYVVLYFSPLFFARISVPFLLVQTVSHLHKKFIIIISISRRRDTLHVARDRLVCS